MSHIIRWKSTIFVLFIFLVITLSGCKRYSGFKGTAGYNGYLAELDNKQLGVSLSSDSEFTEKLCDSILDYINGHTRIKVCGPKIIGPINPKFIFYTRLHNDLNLDYLLFLDISHINFTEIEYKENTPNYSMTTQVQYQCTLSLAYQIIDLEQWKVIKTWQGVGKAIISQDIQQGNAGLNGQRFELVNQAMYNAIFNSGLLSFNKGSK